MQPLGSLVIINVIIESTITAAATTTTTTTTTTAQLQSLMKKNFHSAGFYNNLL
jgi:hypothetical protein